MGWRGARSVFALCSVALISSWLAGCTDAVRREDASETGLRVVPQVQLDRFGNQVEPVANPTPADPSGNGSAVCPLLSLAMAGPLSGSASSLGVDINNGMQLAIDKHNQANLGCQIQLKTFDDEGDPAKSGAIVDKILEDAFTVGLVAGPTFAGEAHAAGEAFDRAGLATATVAGLSGPRWRTSFEAVASDEVEGGAVAAYMTKTLGDHDVCVISDDGGDNAALALAVRDALGPLADASCSVVVPGDGAGFGDAIARINAVGPDAVFFSGSYGSAAPFVDQMRAGGVRAAFMSARLDPDFVGRAGAAAEGAILSCGCSPASEAFAKEYSERFGGEQPGPFSAEAYDLATIMLAGIDSGAITRPALVDFMRAYDGQGVARRYQWTVDGELVNPLIWIYEVQ